MPAPAPLEPRGAPARFAGHLRLEAACDGEGRTALRRQSFQAPFHIGKGYWDGVALQVRVVNPTAGILAGDELQLDVSVAGGGALLVHLPAATRIFTMASGAASSRQLFRVAAGGWLEYAPEPLYPHAGCDFEQETRLEIAEDGEAVFGDYLAPGRAGRGETWAWRRLSLGLEVAIGGRVLLRERLDGSGEDLRGLARFHGMDEAWFGTILLISPKLGDELPLWHRIRALHGAACRIAPTRLAPGSWLVRLVATSGLALRDAATRVRELAAAVLPRLASELRQV